MSFEGVTKTSRMKDNLWGKEKRCSKYVGENIVLVLVRLSQK